MIGADAWLPTGHKRFSRWWWRDVLNMKTWKCYILHKYQRLTRGYSNYDMWNADDYLADVITATAYWHFAHNHGHPAGMTQEEWLDILLEIRDGFSERDEFDELAISDMAWDLLRENYKELWD